MRFEFRAAGDGDRTFEVTGTPVNDSDGDVYHRSGAYRLEGDQLVTPALNEGRPTHVELRGSELYLRIDDSLEFLLHRK